MSNAVMTSGVRVAKPNTRPENPRFSPGPTTKFPGWKLEMLSDVPAGRSHRSGICKERLQEVLDRSRALLGIPDDYRIGIMPGSDTGAFEAAMWCLLDNKRGVDVLAWESFGQDWAEDILKELKLDNTRKIEADYGDLPDLSKVDFSRDVVFTWNGTTSGVRVPNDDWIPDNRGGLVMADATSGAYAMDIPWNKIDVLTYSWQKVMGGEGQHGMLILSPRAVARLENHRPSWPVPKLFRLTEKGKLIEGIFKAATINTPSMIAVEDHLQGLKWAESIGGLKALIALAEANTKALTDWADGSDWAGMLCADRANQSPTSGCLQFTDAWAAALDTKGQNALVKRMLALLEEEDACLDIAGYAKAPPGLRLWTGGTVELANLKAAFPWLDWAFATAKAELQPDGSAAA